MISQNFARDAKLITSEIYDFDTADQRETGINKKRMRLPDRYDIAKFYKRSKKPSSYDMYGNPRYEKGTWKRKREEDLPDITDDFEWQITYSFPRTLHNYISPLGKVYGGRNVTYRRLYLILCERLNGGDFFVDEYFDSVYPRTVKDEVDAKLDELKYDLQEYFNGVFAGVKFTKKGALDKRFKVNKMINANLSGYKAFASSWEDSIGDELASLIADDIKRSLENGQIPLKHINTEATVDRRVWAGYTPEQVFYAMGDLIDNIQLYVKLGDMKYGGKKWRTKQGLVV